MALFVGFMGLAALSNVAGKPGFETMRPVVVVQLIAAGMCFGVSIATLVRFLRGDRSS